MSNFSNSTTVLNYLFRDIYKDVEEVEIVLPQTKEENNSKLRVVTLFSGYGSQELALKYIGVDHTVVAHCDILKSANTVFNTLHNTEKGNLGDISKIDENNFPECDLLTYSFPCQSLSIAGKQEGIAVGTRSGLLFEVERIIKANKPKFLMMENVKNLVSKRHMASFQNHLDLINSLGYGCHWRVLNAADFGCAQNRERVFMMAVLGASNEEVKNKMMSVDNHKKSRVPMRDIVEENVSEKLFINKPFTIHTPKMKSVCSLAARIDGISYQQSSSIYSLAGCSPCLTKSERARIMTEDGRVRYVSARECYRLMGIKEEDIEKMLSTSLSERQHSSLAGNSICVPVMEAIFTQFFKKVRVKSILWDGLPRVA